MIPNIILASYAYSSVETQIEGEGQVYQYVETTVNGQTFKKESNTPGKLELKVESSDEKETIVSFSEEKATFSSKIQNPTLNPTPNYSTPSSVINSEPVFTQITNFLEQLLDKILKFF